MNRYTVGLTVLITGLCWATGTAGVGIIAGRWWLVAPLCGLLIADFIAWKGIGFLVKHADEIVILSNVAYNIVALLKEAERKDAAGTNELLKRLALPPEEFRKGI